MGFMCTYLYVICQFSVVRITSTSCDRKDKFIMVEDDRLGRRRMERTEIIVSVANSVTEVA